MSLACFAFSFTFWLEASQLKSQHFAPASSIAFLALVFTLPGAGTIPKPNDRTLWLAIPDRVIIIMSAREKALNVEFDRSCTRYEAKVKAIAIAILKVVEATSGRGAREEEEEEEEEGVGVGVLASKVGSSNSQQLLLCIGGTG